MLSIINLTALRNIDLSTATAQERARFCATFFKDWDDGAYDGSAYTVTNPNDLASAAFESISWQTLTRLVTRIVRANGSTTVDSSGTTITGKPIPTFSANMAATTGNWTNDRMRRLLVAVAGATGADIKKFSGMKPIMGFV